MSSGGNMTRGIPTIAAVLALLAVLVSLPVVALDDGDEEAAAQPVAAEPPSHMPESVRAAVSKVVVLPEDAPTQQGLTGSYKKETSGLLGGWQAGQRMSRRGREFGPVWVGISIPILELPGAVLGGLTGLTKQQIQDFRDALTEDLVYATDKPLSNEKLATDVFWQIRGVPSLEPKVLAMDIAVPADTDAVLYVSLTDVSIDIEKNDAIITTSASTSLRRSSDGHELYRQTVHYQDRDTLRNWNADDNALWRDYTNFARHYIGREIAAEVFERVEINNQLTPAQSASIKTSKKDLWSGQTRTRTPTLSWDFELLGDNHYGAWADAIQPSDVAFDVEIYDRQKLIYAERQIPSTQHTVQLPLEPCGDYRWSVRPSYTIGSDRKFGDWMRGQPEEGDASAYVGRRVSVAPAYLQDFAQLSVHCKSQ